MLQHKIVQEEVCMLENLLFSPPSLPQRCDPPCMDLSSLVCQGRRYIAINDILRVIQRLPVDRETMNSKSFMDKHDSPHHATNSRSRGELQEGRAFKS
jgi:hypothetical protein